MSVPVLAVAEMRAWEQASWAAGVRESDVIASVGLQLAAAIRAATSETDRVLVLVGRGNNGADARAAAAHLGSRVADVLEVRDPAADLPKLSAALLPKPALVVDGLFGIGLNRPLDPAWVQFIETLNQSRLRVLSVDVPSGLDADTGEHWGAAVHAWKTATVGAPKRGLLEPAAWTPVGTLEVLREVGLAGKPVAADERDWVLAEDFESWPPPRGISSNKGDLGRLVVIAGSVGYAGAAILSARSASRARPGLLAALVPETVHGVVSGAVPSAMVHSFEPYHSLWDRAAAVLAGPGLAAPDLPAELRAEVLRLWREFPGAMVVDASALAWLVEMPKTWEPAGLRILTPHPGEAARLLRSTVAGVQENRVAALRALAVRYRSLVVLKGHQTLTGTATGRIQVNSSGNPGLAQGGTGDVLAGYLAGLLAQPGMAASPERTAAYAVWEHGRTADRLESVRRNWTAEDLADAIGA
ncbi:MAG: NAD(P)H-hydrate dehydratase [Verrucomicrobiae bacterium]|nr:NAD(P)H-hydrate dehydratase [Verrucomicrobiae bacterium]